MTLILCTLLVAGCGSEAVFFGQGVGNENRNMTINEAIKTLDDQGQLPKIDRSNTLLGVDADGNGVRGDVDEFINKNADSNEKREALRQMARLIDKKLLANSEEEVAQHMSQIGASVSCIHHHFSGDLASRLIHDIEKITINTKVRLLKYTEFVSKADGHTLSLTNGMESCEYQQEAE